MLNWSELEAVISQMTDEQKQTDVTIYDIEQDEFYAAGSLQFNDGPGVLDDDHPYLTLPR